MLHVGPARRGGAGDRPARRWPCFRGTRQDAVYIGVTSDPLGRWWRHREKQLRGFTDRYGVTRLVYVGFFGDMEHDVLRERQLKRWHRAWKINRIEAAKLGGPTWRQIMASSR